MTQLALPHVPTHDRGPIIAHKLIAGCWHYYTAAGVRFMHFRRQALIDWMEENEVKS